MTELEFQYRAELREMRVLDGREAFEKLMVDGGLRLPFAEAYDAIEYECERSGPVDLHDREASRQLYRLRQQLSRRQSAGI